MSRIQTMIDALESGEDLSHLDLKTLLKLQVLDITRAGEVFVQESIEREREADA